MSRPVVIVMIKAPRAGFVKTRLTPTLSETEAATLAICFAQDVLESMSRVAGNLIVAYAPSDGRTMLEPLLPGELNWLEQRGHDLGERLEWVAAHAFNLGFGPVLFIGTDSPTLPQSFISTAIQSLETAASDIVLGPTEDGGYYLIGLRNCVRGIFQNIEWSSTQTYSQTTHNATRLGLRIKELPLWYDVDTPSDLLRLRAEIFSDKEARERAPETSRWMMAHDSLFTALNVPRHKD